MHTFIRSLLYLWTNNVSRSYSYVNI